VQLLSLGAFAALFAFLAWRARNNPLFVAGAAAFLAMGRSAFIDIVPDQLLIDWLRFGTSDLIFAALVIGWMYARRRRRVPHVRLSARWVGLGVLLLFLFALEFGFGVVHSGFQPMAIMRMRDWFYIPIGYLIALDILRRFTSVEVEQYVGALSLFTTCLMVLYIASAMGIGVYPYPKYLVVKVSDATIIRDFYTFPIWFTLAAGYYLAQAKKNGWTFVALAVLAAGAALSYTRSVILVFVAVAVLATILPMASRGHAVRALVVGAGVASVAIFILVYGPVLAPTQYDYLRGRFATISSPRDALSDPNLSFRLDQVEQAYRAGERTNPMFGAGLYETSPSLVSLQYRSYESDWIRIAYHTGLAGLVTLAAPLVLALVWGISGYVRSKSPVGIDALLLAGVLATVCSAGWRSMGLVYFWWPALSLFSVALIAYAMGFPVAAANPSRLHNEPGKLANGL